MRRKLNKIIVVYIGIVFSLFIISSCDPCGGNDGFRSYEFIGFTTNPVKYNSENRNNFIVLLDSANAKSDSTSFLINYIKSKYVSTGSKNKYTFFNSAIACDLASPRSRNNITSFVLIAQNNFNDTILQNDTISLEDYSIDGVKASLFTNRYVYHEQNMIKLLTKPTPNTYQSFKFILRTDNGLILENTSPILLFTE